MSKIKNLMLIPETTYQAIVGSVVTRIRKEMGVEQSALAEAVGVNQSTWSRIERGESALNIEQLFLAAEHLRIKPSIIMFESESAVADLQKQGVKVTTAKSKDRKIGQGAALIGATALGGLVGAAVLKARQKSKNSDSET